MSTPDLTQTAKLAHAMCRAASGHDTCTCAKRKYPQHCETMEVAARNVMTAAGLTHAQVRAVLTGPVNVTRKPAKKQPK